MTELPPCPFCQSEAYEIAGSEQMHPVERMAKCIGCGASAPLTLWNTRAPVFSKDDVEKVARELCAASMEDNTIENYDHYWQLQAHAALSAIGKVEG